MELDLPVSLEHAQGVVGEEEQGEGVETADRAPALSAGDEQGRMWS